MVILELVAMCSCVGLTDLSMLSPNKGMVGLKLTLDKGGGGGGANKYTEPELCNILVL